MLRTRIKSPQSRLLSRQEFGPVDPAAASGRQNGKNALNALSSRLQSLLAWGISASPFWRFGRTRKGRPWWPIRRRTGCLSCRRETESRRRSFGSGITIDSLGLRRKLNGKYVDRAADEDDIALSAFASFYRAAEQGRFPQLSDSTDLWRLLIAITQRKISRRVRNDNRQKRRPLTKGASRLDPVELADVASNEPTPAFYVAAIDSFRDLIDRLGDPTLQSIALLKMEGYTNDEIGRQLACSVSTVERKLRRIRHEWANIADDWNCSG